MSVRPGEHKAKLTREQAWAVKYEPALELLNNSEIARMYGVYPSTIRDVRLGKTWGWLKKDKTQFWRMGI